MCKFPINIIDRKVLGETETWLPKSWFGKVIDTLLGCDPLLRENPVNRWISSTEFQTMETLEDYYISWQSIHI